MHWHCKKLPKLNRAIQIETLGQNQLWLNSDSPIRDWFRPGTAGEWDLWVIHDIDRSINYQGEKKTRAAFSLSKTMWNFQRESFCVKQTCSLAYRVSYHVSSINSICICRDPAVLQISRLRSECPCATHFTETSDQQFPFLARVCEPIEALGVLLSIRQHSKVAQVKGQTQVWHPPLWFHKYTSYFFLLPRKHLFFFFSFLNNLDKTIHTVKFRCIQVLPLILRTTVNLRNS